MNPTDPNPASAVSSEVCSDESGSICAIVNVELASVQEPHFSKGSKALQWVQYLRNLGCNPAGYFIDQTSKLSVAGFQRPPNILIAVNEREGVAWSEVVRFYSDKRCDAWSNFPGREPNQVWLEMDHDSRMDLSTLVASSSNAVATGKRDVVPASHFAKYYGEYLFRKGSPSPEGEYSSAQLSSTPLVGKFDNEVMAFAEEFIRGNNHRAGNWSVDSVSSGKTLLTHSPHELAQILSTAFRLTRRVKNRTGYDVLSILREHLLKMKLPLTEKDVEILCEQLKADRQIEEILDAIETACKSHPLSANARTLLRSWGDNATEPFQDRIEMMLCETGFQIPIMYDGSFWAKNFISTLVTMPEKKRIGWIDLLHHCAQATSSKASTRWEKSAAALIDNVGHVELHAMISTWPPMLVDIQKLVNRDAFLGVNQDILRGLIWCMAIKPNARTPVTLREIGQSAFKSLIEVGPRTRVGNTCVQALGQIGNINAVAQLAILKAKVKNGNALRGIAKQLEETARRLGVRESELEEISVPSFDLDEVGSRVTPIGDFTAQLVVTTQGAKLNWFRNNGTQQKAVPSNVKNQYPDELKELRDETKDIDSILSVQRARFESLYCVPHGWDFATWKDRYLNHPLVSVLSRKLIWHFTDGRTESSGIWHHGQLITSGGVPLKIANEATVRLWHPLNEPTARVLAWRTWIIDNQLEQPFKQAHREIYLLTDAERHTETYSNRFAAHFLRLPQCRAIAQSRHWKINGMGGFHGGDPGTVRKEFPHHGIAVEFWLNDAGESDLGGYGSSYVSSDQVCFYQLANQQPVHLELVPPIVFSEAMRDVDLLVSVCSIGNDPSWMDNGNRSEEFDGYWQSQAKADLTESGKVRREVLEQIVPRLKISEQCELHERVLTVQGKLRKYRIHLGSGNVMMEPNNQYLCIVQDRGPKGHLAISLPFSGDTLLALILSKAFLLADDDKIKDKSILRQIKS